VKTLLQAHKLGVKFGTQVNKLTMADCFNTQRYEFLNMNGLKWLSSDTITDNGEGFKMSQSIGATIIGRAETNTDWNYNDGMARKITTTQIKKAYNHAVCTFSDSRIRTRDSPYKPGGTLTAVANPWHGHVTDTGSDSRLGNWTYVTLRGKGKTKLTYITVYRVNDQSALKTELNAMSGGRGQQRANTQQLQILRDENKTNVLPRHNCFNELRELFKDKFADDGHEVIMGIDANESMTGNGPRSLRRFMSDVGLHDAIAFANPGRTRGKTMKHSGTEANDHILATGGVLPFIIGAGELEYDYTYIADHPSLFIDIDGSLLSQDFTHFCNDQGRNLKYNDKIACQKYIATLEKLCTDNRIHERATALSLIEPLQWTASHTLKLNNLDNHITRLMLRAEKKCKKRKGKGHMYSEELHLATSRTSYWHHVKKSMLPSRNISAVTLHRKRKFARIPDHLPLTKHEVNTEHKSAQKTLKDVRAKSTEYRRLHLERFAAAIDADAGRTPGKTNTLLQLQRHEERRQIYKKCQLHMGKGRGPGIKELLVPNDPHEEPSNDTTEWTVEGDRDNVTNAIMTQNEKCFSKAFHTPFACGELKDVLGADGTTAAGDEMLRGTFEITSPISELKEFIQTFKKNPNIPDITPTITSKMFGKAFGRVHEKKATSASGRHLGHYKAIMHNPKLTELMCTMMSLPWKHGICIDRWLKVIDVMLSKDEGICRLHKLRIIQLIEADFNQCLLMLFTKPITHNMDKYEARSPCQWAQRGQSCTSAVLYKILQIEDARIMHYSMSWMETDYAGCYDRIMPNVALINSQKFGATKSACRTLGKVWQGLQHHVKTANGVSSKHYPIEVSGNIHSGSGQGSVYATLCWEGITQQIISILEKEKSASVTNCFTLQITSRTCNFYVDDKSLMCTHDQNESTTQNVKNIVHTIATRLQTLTQKSERLVFVTGGGLQPSKCLWYAIVWGWNEHGEAYMLPVHQTPAEIWLTVGTTLTPLLIQRKETNETSRTLGCHIAPDANTKTEQQLLMNKALHFGAAARRRGTTKTEAYYKYVVYINTAMAFPLGVSRLSHKQLTDIQRKYLRPTKQQMGFRGTIAAAFMHAPRAYLGVGLPSLPITRDLLHLRMLCGHLREDSDTTHMLLATLSGFQLASGLTTPVLQTPIKYSKWSEPGWLLTCWEILDMHTILLHSESFIAPPLLRDNDTGLMQLLSDTNKYDNWQLREINRVRIYLRVTTISDVATACGTRINRDRYDINDPIPLENTKYKWPIQANPGKRAWDLWRNALRQLIHGMSDTRLTTPLGQWTGEPRQTFTWFARPNLQSVIQTQHHTSTQHIVKTKHHNSRSASREYLAQGRNFNAHWPSNRSTALFADVSVRKGSKVIILHHTMPQYHTPTTIPLPPIETVGDYIARLHPFLQALLPTPSTFDHNFTTRAATAAHGPIRARTHGPPNTRAHHLNIEWAILDDTNTTITQHQATIPCRPEESRTKRGIQLSLIAIHIITTALTAVNVTLDTIELDATSYNTLDWTKYGAPRQGYNCLSKPNTDVGKELQNWTRSSPTIFTTPETTPERDEDSDSEDDAPQCLTRTTTTTTQSTTPIYPPASKYTLTIDAQTYNYLPEQLIRERHHLPLFKKFLKDNCSLPTAVFDTVAWELATKAINSLNITRLLPVLKFTANEWSTGDKQHTHFNKPDTCPFCKAPETMKHVYSCNHKNNITFRDKTITSFHTQLTKIDQQSGDKWASLLHTALHELGGRFNTAHDTVDIPPPLLRAQQSIGWFHLLQGRIHTDLWEYLRRDRGTTTDVIAIKALWKLASVFWRRRNRKKHGRSHKEKRYIKKTALDEEITAFRTILQQLEIPHTPVPLGYRHRVDAKLAWLRWEKSSMHLWKKGKLDAYISFHSPNTHTPSSLHNSDNTTPTPQHDAIRPPSDPPD
jgi:hypothetical protein